MGVEVFWRIVDFPLQFYSNSWTGREIEKVCYKNSPKGDDIGFDIKQLLFTTAHVRNLYNNTLEKAQAENSDILLFVVFCFLCTYDGVHCWINLSFYTNMDKPDLSTYLYLNAVF